jgi:hypothetical protein
MLPNKSGACIPKNRNLGCYEKKITMKLLITLKHGISSITDADELINDQTIDAIYIANTSDHKYYGLKVSMLG